MTGFRDEDSFGDLLESIQAILEYAAVGHARFMRETMVRDAIVRRFEVAGEATKRLSPAFRQRHKALPWKQLAGFRDILIHHYEKVEAGEIWRTIQASLPELLSGLERVRKAEGW